MQEIKNILICGLGAIGTICAYSISQHKEYNLKILIDESRFYKYSKTPTIFNKKECIFDYVLPNNQNFKADLIIVATKNDGLNSAIKQIKNFIKENTIIISLLNGIHSEKEIQKEYQTTNVITSFYIGNSSIRKDREITHDGIYKIFFDKENKDSELLKNLFDKTKIKYNFSENIQNEYWKKFIINIGLNQICAAYNLTLNQIKEDPTLIEELKELMKEAKQIALLEGIKNADDIYNEALNFVLNEMLEATPSMLQDIRNKRKTEIDIFAIKIMEYGCKYGLRTPYNEKIFCKIQEIERNF